MFKIDQQLAIVLIDGPTEHDPVTRTNHMLTGIWVIGVILLFGVIRDVRAPFAHHKLAMLAVPVGQDFF